VTLDSTEPVKAFIESMPAIINIRLESLAGAASTTVTVGGLQPDTTYYKYTDNLHQAEAFTTDADGRYSFVQDISAAHVIHILTRPSTLFMSDNATGGDCATVGTWDPATRTCTLTADVNQTIQIDSDSIVLDGNGHALSGSGGTWGGSFGVYLYGRRGVAVRNLTVTNCGIGIYLNGSYSNTVNGNTLTGNYSPIVLGMVNGYNTVSNNTIVQNGAGISCYYACYGNVFDGNYLYQNGSGFYMWDGFSNQYRNNTVDSSPDQPGANGHDQLASSYNVMEGNTYSNHQNGLLIRDATYCPYSYCGGSGRNTIRKNNITNNSYGLNFGTGRFNIFYPNPLNEIYSNNFTNNAEAVYNPLSYQNIFNAEKPTGGNYWSNFDSAEEGCADTDSDGFCDAPFVIGSYQDNYPHTFPIGSNNLPTAEAGPDQVLLYGNAVNGASVTLDGSASADPDGDTLTYSWTWEGGSAEGVQASIVLPKGTTTVTLTVDDGKGGRATDTVNVGVVYSFGGFLQPVTLGRSFKLGSTAPVKFQLTDATGAYVTTAQATIRIALVAGNDLTGDTIDGTSTVGDAGTAFRYDSTDNQYIFNLSLAGLDAGRWRLLVSPDDGTTYSLDIGIK
jgi:parallel beta-helix repeat protein